MMDEVQVRPDQVIVRAGRVILYAEYQGSKDGDRKSVELRSISGGDHFACALDRASGEKSSNIDSLESVLTHFHPDVSEKYRKLFSLERPTEADIRQTGLSHDLEIVFQ